MILGYRELSSQSRVGGLYNDLESAEATAEHLSFDCYVSDFCRQGRSFFFLVPASSVSEPKGAIE